MKKITQLDRWHYRFDNLMSRGTIALVVALFILSAGLILFISFLVLVAAPEGQQMSYGQIVWMSLLRTLDPGTMGGDVGDWRFVGSMFLVTVGGIFVVSTLIGVLSSGIQNRLEELRKGRSLVVEENHTVILGWSAQVFPIISELAVANENRRKACIAILAPIGKVEMEDAIHAKIPDTENTRVVCRTGSPMDLNDLEIINPHLARSIIVLSPEGSDPDAQVIKTILALTNNPKRGEQPYHIVASIRDPHNMEAARLVSEGEAQLILADDLISRIIAQTCRQSGLSVVYNELLDFSGDEIYFQEEPALVGKTFGEAIFCYEDSSVIGLCCRDGKVQLNPPMDVGIQAGDQIIAISRDDDTIQLSSMIDYGIDARAIFAGSPRPKIKERTLILGWNPRAARIIKELDRYVAPGSEVLVMTDVPQAETRLACDCEGLENMRIDFREGDATSRRTLDELAIETYDHVIILSYNLAGDDTQKADARTLVTLLHLRHIAEKVGHPFSIVSEMLDIRNRELAEVAHVDDFIVSDRLVSLVLSQVSENKRLMEVFEDLFNPEGSEIYLKPAGDYVHLDQPVNFYTVLESARCRNEVAIGYRLRLLADEASKSYGVRINPPKSQAITFAKHDRVILLAEE
jgi:voltage-gated potassium channel Kch